MKSAQAIFIVSTNSPHPLVFTVDTVKELEPTSVIVPSILYLFPSIEYVKPSGKFEKFKP